MPQKLRVIVVRVHLVQVAVKKVKSLVVGQAAARSAGIAAQSPLAVQRGHSQASVHRTQVFSLRECNSRTGLLVFLFFRSGTQNRYDLIDVLHTPQLVMM